MKIISKQRIKALSLVIGTLVLVGFARFWYLENQGNFHPITPGEAYRSAQLDKDELIFYIKRYEISSIINLRGRKDNESWYANETKVCQKYNVHHYDLGMSADETPSDSTIKALLRLFKEAPRPILIHCKAGADRSGLGAALWKMVVDGVPKAEAQKELSIWYGHLPIGPTQVLDELVKRYRVKR